MASDRRVVTKGAVKCPECGGRLVPILYGLPDAEAGAAAERGEIALGGCTIMGDEPHLQCVGCRGAFWTTRPRS